MLHLLLTPSGPCRDRDVLANKNDPSWKPATVRCTHRTPRPPRCSLEPLLVLPPQPSEVIPVLSVRLYKRGKAPPMQRDKLQNDDSDGGCPPRHCARRWPLLHVRAHPPLPSYPKLFLERQGIHRLRA